MMENNDNAIVFPFVVAKTQTLADGAPRITIDLPENCIAQMAMLAQAKLDGIYLVATVRAKAKEDDERGKARKTNI